MATWKKLVVSGSDISQLNNDAGYLTSVTAQHAFTTASFDGTNLLADSAQGTLNFASGSTGLNIVANAGTDTLTFDLVRVPNASLLNDGITFGSDDVSLGDSVQQMSLTGFTGSLSATSTLADGVTATTQSPGDNSTKVATTAYVDAQVTAEDLDIAGDGSTTTAVDLDSQTLTFSGADGIEASASAQAITVGIADGGIANAKLANSSVHISGSGISGASVALGATASIDVQVDDSTIEISSDSLQVKDGGVTNAKLAFSSIHIGDTSIALGATGSTIDALTLTNVVATGSYTGSFVGDGSGLTGIATTLSHRGDSGTGTVDLLTQTLDIAGGTNINTVANANEITVNLDSNISVTEINASTAIVSGDLTVLGTASFNHETNVQVADRFILLASGSTTTGDGGIIVQQATQDIGEVFGFDGITGDERWGIGQNQHASGSTFTAQAFMAAVLTGSASSDTAIDALVADRYEAKGNLFIGDDEGIWIWS